MDNNKGVEMSELHLSDAERQPCEVWTRRCHGLSQTSFRV
jgi:hypothetical protein